MEGHKSVICNEVRKWKGTYKYVFFFSTTQVEWLNLEGFGNRSIWLVSISQMRPLERLYMATFSAYVTANKIACILRTLRGGPPG